MNRIWSCFIIQSVPMPDTLDRLFKRLIFSLFEDIFSILLHLTFPNFKVLDIFLKVIIRTFVAKGEHPSYLGKVSYIEFCFLFHFSLGGKDYVVPFDTVVTGILDMRQGEHVLHFLVGVELLPHAFVNIPNEKMHIGVIHFYFSYLLCIYLFMYLKIWSYIFIYSSLLISIIRL
jgi:hypothetical protein